MATTNRRPLSNRPISAQLIAPNTPRNIPVKRSHSPDQIDFAASRPIPKRARAIVHSPATQSNVRDPNKERSRSEREQQKAEFKEKYCRAFPYWTFYLDLENMDSQPATVQALKSQILQLGGTIEDFFSRQITHLITNKPSSGPQTTLVSEKENAVQSVAKVSHTLKSPIKLRGRVISDDTGTGFDLVSKACSFGIKIWTPIKLESVLSRCLDLSVSPSVTTHRTSSLNPAARSLSRLLQSEKIHGTTERDPTQKRHDFRYFSRSSKFILIEDLRQELSTIAAHEYPNFTEKDENSRAPWPVLFCHPKSRGPFIPFDDREKRRWEKLQNLDALREKEKAQMKENFSQAKAIKRKAAMCVKQNGDLRRSVSLNNLQQHVVQSPVDVYMAASGNSVGITSTAGTTSTASYTSRNVPLSTALNSRIRQEVVTSRKFTAGSIQKTSCKFKTNIMGPPTHIPARNPTLRKSKSTNTLKLPKREEGIKPGYCESCRTKFEDFKDHVSGKKHKKFALDDANFVQLDYILSQVQRRTVQEVEDSTRKRAERYKQLCN